jgi:GNAT superfamily N-acetyltransferase
MDFDKRSRPVQKRLLTQFVIDQQNRNRESLGFLPGEAIRTYADRGAIIPATANGELVSYGIFFDGQPGCRPRVDPYDLRIYQLLTDYDARRLQHATRIVNLLYDHARQHSFRRMRLWCADDLPANVFWATLGFNCQDTRTGGFKRHRIHNLWVLDIPAIGTTKPFEILDRPVANPGKTHNVEPSTFRPKSTSSKKPKPPKPLKRRTGR